LCDHGGSPGPSANPGPRYRHIGGQPARPCAHKEIPREVFRAGDRDGRECTATWGARPGHPSRNRGFRRGYRQLACRRGDSPGARGANRPMSETLPSDWADIAPFAQTLGAVVKRASDGEAELFLPFAQSNTNRKHDVHGGVLGSMIDLVGSAALRSVET